MLARRETAIVFIAVILGGQTPAAQAAPIPTETLKEIGKAALVGAAQGIAMYLFAPASASAVGLGLSEIAAKSVGSHWSWSAVLSGDSVKAGSAYLQYIDQGVAALQELARNLSGSSVKAGSATSILQSIDQAIAALQKLGKNLSGSSVKAGSATSILQYMKQGGAALQELAKNLSGSSVKAGLATLILQYVDQEGAAFKKLLAKKFQEGLQELTDGKKKKEKKS